MRRRKDGSISVSPVHREPHATPTGSDQYRIRITHQGMQGQAQKGREVRGHNAAIRLRFCPNSNDLLYPKEDREQKKLVYACLNCNYRIDAEDFCVHRHSIRHTAAETTTIIQDIRTDPTLPRSTDVQCPRCDHKEAVFFSLTTPEGMSLYFQCLGCANKWKDEGGEI